MDGFGSVEFFSFFFFFQLEEKFAFFLYSRDRCANIRVNRFSLETKDVEKDVFIFGCTCGIWR